MSTPKPTPEVGRLRALLGDAVARSLVVMTAAAIVVGVAAATGVMQRAVEHAGAHGGADHVVVDHGVAGHGAMVVRSEADFIAGMIPHHREAVESAAALLEVTERPEVRELAEAIVREQAAEIEQLEAWLAAWYPGHDPGPYEPMMRPFLGLTPTEADEVFVTDMIHHHAMAIDMAQAYLALPVERRSEVVALADAVIRVQRAEIALLEMMLRMWGVATPDHGAH